MSQTATSAANNITSADAAETGGGPRTPGGVAMIDAVNNAHQGFHPLRSLWGLTGHGSRGTLRRKHVFTLCCKLVLGIGQVGLYITKIYLGQIIDDGHPRLHRLHRSSPCQSLHRAPRAPQSQTRVNGTHAIVHWVLGSSYGLSESSLASPYRYIALS
jgi:hypothetical protein